MNHYLPPHVDPLIDAKFTAHARRGNNPNPNPPLNLNSRLPISHNLNTSKPFYYLRSAKAPEIYLPHLQNFHTNLQLISENQDHTPDVFHLKAFSSQYFFNPPKHPENPSYFSTRKSKSNYQEKHQYHPVRKHQRKPSPILLLPWDAKEKLCCEILQEQTECNYSITKGTNAVFKPQSQKQKWNLFGTKDCQSNASHSSPPSNQKRSSNKSLIPARRITALHLSPSILLDSKNDDKSNARVKSSPHIFSGMVSPPAIIRVRSPAFWYEVVRPRQRNS